jgi:hypothetical protein
MHFIFFLNNILANKLLKTLWPFKISVITDQIVKLNQNKSTKWKCANSYNEILAFIKINWLIYSLVESQTYMFFL